MFTFGIFASHTPFLIMAGLYLFYMLLSFGAKLNAQEATEVSRQKCLFAEEITPSVKAAHHTLELSAKDFDKDDNEQLESDTKPARLFWKEPARLIILYSHSYVQKHINLCIYSRPPPAFS